MFLIQLSRAQSISFISLLANRNKSKSAGGCKVEYSLSSHGHLSASGTGKLSTHLSFSLNHLLRPATGWQRMCHSALPIPHPEVFSGHLLNMQIQLPRPRAKDDDISARNFHRQTSVTCGRPCCPTQHKKRLNPSANRFVVDG